MRSSRGTSPGAGKGRAPRDHASARSARKMAATSRQLSRRSAVSAAPAEWSRAKAATRLAARRKGAAISPEKPSRRDQSRRRRGLGATLNMRRPALQAPGFGAVDPWIGGGSLPAPLFAPGRRVRFGSMRANRNGAMELLETPCAESVGQAAGQGGCCPCPVRKRPGERPRKRDSYSREPGARSSTARCARSASIARCGRSFRPKLPVLRQPSSVR